MLGNPVFVAMDREKMGAAAKSQVRGSFTMAMSSSPFFLRSFHCASALSRRIFGFECCCPLPRQAGFLEFLVMPLFQAWSDHTLDTTGLDNLKANIAHWKEMDRTGWSTRACSRFEWVPLCWLLCRW